MTIDETARGVRKRGSSCFSNLLHTCLLLLPCIRKCFMDSLIQWLSLFCEMMVFRFWMYEIISRHGPSCVLNFDLLNHPWAGCRIPSRCCCCRHSCRPCAESSERHKKRFVTRSSFTTLKTYMLQSKHTRTCAAFH